MSESLLAEVEFYSNRGREAAARIKGTIDRHGSTVEHWERLGDTYESLGRRNDARVAWIRATQLAGGPPTRAAHGKLAGSYRADGQGKLAASHSAQEALAAGIIEFDDGNLTSALAAFETAIGHDPKFVSAWYYLGETLRRQGANPAARGAFDKCLELAPHHGRAADGRAELAG